MWGEDRASTGVIPGAGHISEARTQSRQRGPRPQIWFGEITEEEEEGSPPVVPERYGKDWTMLDGETGSGEEAEELPVSDHTAKDEHHSVRILGSGGDRRCFILQCYAKEVPCVINVMQSKYARTTCTAACRVKRYIQPWRGICQRTTIFIWLLCQMDGRRQIFVFILVLAFYTSDAWHVMRIVHNNFYFILFFSNLANV